jgi:hypothetical protein
VFPLSSDIFKPLFRNDYCGILDKYLSGGVKMKTSRILSGVIVIAATLFLAGCYTQFATRGAGGYGYGYDQGSQYDQSPADSTYGDQYGDQNYPDSTYGQDNYDYGNPPYAPYYGSDYGYNSPNIYSGLYWSSPFYDPFYWDPYGLWSYYPGLYMGAFGFYPYYHNLYYGGYGYGYGGYGYGQYGNGNNFTRTRGRSNLRTNDGTRNPGGREGIAGTHNTPYPTTAARGTRPGYNGAVTRGGNRTSRINRQAYQNQRREYYRYYNRNNSYSRNNAQNRNNTYNRNNNSAGSQRSVSRPAPQRQSGYYSAPRSSSGSSAGRSYSGGGNSSRGSSGGGSSSGGRRGR